MYNQTQKLKDPLFRRKTGIKRQTFEKMVEIVKKAEQQRKKLPGRPLKLSYEDQVLITLEYLREYRTYFSIGQIYGLSESNTYKTIKRIEDILIKAKEFRLPNRKDVFENPDMQVVVVDAAESAIERPKKNSGTTIQERKRSTPLKHS
jgi:hypothetical protein